MTAAAQVPRPRLLYIDDDPGLGRLVEKDLTRNGFDVSLAQSADEGLRRLREDAFDVVALDHFLPGRTGIECLADIRAIANAPPVVYVTGTEEGRVAVAALKAGACDYVIKDTSPEFLALLRAALEQALLQRELHRQKEAAEREMIAARERAEALLREVNHRVGNSLQLVSTFVSMQTEHIADQNARTLLKDTQARILAVAQIHRRLYTSDDVHTVEMREYLQGLIEELNLSLARQDAPTPLILDAEPVRIATDKAISAGVIVTELVTNAFKYAYPQGGRGPVRVFLKRQGDEVSLAVEDDGVGWTPGTTARGSGLGQKIIQAMAASLRTAVTYDAKQPGTRARLTFAA